VLFAGAEALMPVFAAEILRVGAEGLGLLRAAPAAGSVLMSVYLSHRPLRGQLGRTLLVSVALYGVCISCFGLSRSVVLSLLLLALSGMFDNISVVLRSTLLQTLTPRQLLGVCRAHGLTRTGIAFIPRNSIELSHSRGAPVSRRSGQRDSTAGRAI